ncbi:MAG: hypothetical protein Kow00121_52760 [Elainellaceae cyanobacterium]
MINSAKSKIDTLVVGAGPVGLAIACELRRHGVDCRIIDKAAEPVQTSRALGIQARTLEVFEDMGVIDSVLAAGTKAVGATFHSGDRDILHFSLRHIRDQESAYPFLLILPQSQTEAILNQRLHELGGKVERSRELVDICQEEDGAIAQVKSTEAGNIEEIHARWLIGCDGASSQVRKVLDIPFEGTTAPEEWLLADVDLDWNRTRETTHGWFTSDGVFAVFPLPNGQWRLFAPAGQASEASVETFQQLLRQYTGNTETTVSHPSWMSKFRVHYRMVNNYRQDRVFLAGDAAHIHSPFGGQGMNIGIQDAYNLAWKLALVLHGKAQENLLDTYHEERSPIARYVLRGTQAATQGILVTQNIALRWLRDRLLVPLLSLNFFQRKLAQEASELKMNYRGSSLSDSRFTPGANLTTYIDWWKAPHAGDRALPGKCLSYPAQTTTNLLQVFHDTKSHLLLFAGLTATQDSSSLSSIASNFETRLGDAIKAHIVTVGSEKPDLLNWTGSTLLDPQGTLHKLYGAQQASLYFIRPDGYVGFRSQPLDEKQLLHYLSQVFDRSLRLF